MALVLSAFVDKFMGILSQLAQDEVDELLGVSSEIENLNSMTRLIRGVLVDAEKRQTLNEAFKCWMLDLKDIMYDVDNVVDLCQITNKKRRIDISSSSCAVANWWNNFLSSIRNPIFARQIASKIKRINSRMDTIVRQIPLLSLTEDNNYPSHARRDANANFKTSPVLVLADLVGEQIEDDAEKLIKLLTKEATDQEKKDITIVAVEGIGGIGKTTLAKKVYNDLRIKEEFQLLIWICVSKELGRVDILKNVIREVGGDYGVAEEISELAPKLAKCIAGKKFFLVLDDIWEESEKVWEGLLREPMISGAHRSRVLVTTRDGGVALRMKAIYRHKVSRLSDEDALSLLIRQVDPNGFESDVIQHLHDVGMELVRKCDGLPLAIKSVGGMLCMKNKSRSEWQAVSRSNVWSMIGLPSDVYKAFHLSFGDLSLSLKQCFIFCSLFPEDFKFQKSSLIYLWLAEGYLQGTETFWDIGTKYYKELLLRNLLEDSGFLYGQNECKMHDLLWSFARYFENNENSTLRDGNFLFKPEDSFKIRRLSVEGNTVNTDIIIKEKWLRTLLFFTKHEIALDKICKALCDLRILDLSESHISTLPASLCELQHLRYLHIGGSKISTLPNSIGNLRNLVYLNCERCKELVHVPGSITNLRELRFLSFYKTSVKRIPTNLKNLEELVFLFGFQIDKNTFEGFSSLDELEPLSQLVVLQIVGLENVTEINIAQRASLRRKNRLREIYFCYTSLSKEDQISQTNEKKALIENILNECSPPPHLEVLKIESYFGSTLPNWLNFNADFPNLRVLEIMKCACIKELAPLGQLSNLDFLRLWGVYSVENIGREFFRRHDVNEDSKPIYRSNTPAFPKLNALELVKMYNWKEWQWNKEEQAMPKLKKLYLIDCPQLRSLPEGLSHQATYLEHLEIRGMNNLNTIQNLQFVKDMNIVDCPNLERISNLPDISYILINKCANLKTLEYLNALQRMELVDYEMDSLPEYLETTALHTLIIRCSINLLCKITSQQESGSERLKLKHICKVNIWTEDESLYAT